VITALCFIKVSPEAINSAGEQIARISGVRAAYSVTGQIDLSRSPVTTTSPAW